MNVSSAIKITGVTDVSEELEWYRNLTPLYQESICAKPCKPGEARIKAPDNKCCWTCHPCDEYHYLKVLNLSLKINFYQ